MSGRQQWSHKAQQLSLALGQWCTVPSNLEKFDSVVQTTLWTHVAKCSKLSTLHFDWKGHVLVTCLTVYIYFRKHQCRKHDAWKRVFDNFTACWAVLMLPMPLNADTAPSRQLHLLESLANSKFPIWKRREGHSKGASSSRQQGAECINASLQPCIRCKAAYR